MKSEKLHPLAQKLKSVEDHPELDRETASKRAHLILTVYDSLYPGLGQDVVLPALFYDILQLCERHPKFRSFKEGYMDALAYHLGDFSFGCVDDEIERLEGAKKAKRC